MEIFLGWTKVCPRKSSVQELFARESPHLQETCARQNSSSPSSCHFVSNFLDLSLAPKADMPKPKFSADAEKKFLEPWHAVLVEKDKKMLSRAEKVAVVTWQLNAYLSEIGSKETYNESQVNNKVDTAKAKGKEIYKNIL